MIKDFSDSICTNVNGCRLAVSVPFLLYLVSSLLMYFPESVESLYIYFTYFALLWFFIYLFLPKRSVVCCLGVSCSGVRALLIKLLAGIGVFALLLNCVVIYYSSVLFNDLGISITQYKNDGVADEVLKSVVPYNILFFARVLSPLGYLCLVLLFAFFERLSSWVCFFLLLGTFNIFLVHFHVFSRSMLVVYFIAVPALFVYYRIYDRLNLRYGSMSFVKLLLSLVLFVLGFTISYLTFERFEAMNTWWRFVEYEGPFGPVLFSIFHYLSSSYEVFLYLFDNDVLPPFLGSGAESFSIFNNRFNLQLLAFDFGQVNSGFKSIVIALVYDLGVLGFFVFFIFFYLIEFSFRSIFRVVFVVFSLFFVSAFFFGNIFVYEYVWLGLFYSLFFSFLFFAVNGGVKCEEL